MVRRDGSAGLDDRYLEQHPGLAAGDGGRACCDWCDEHLCHRPGCGVPVPPKMFACAQHWFDLPKPIRDAIWAAYRPGQERDKDPSVAYLAAAVDAFAFWSQS